ncbi:hypothetical protein EYF80_060537 [Liparis tanakae]|uniref:Uncharacterized protein n=1 Tax=Liparis tanakae TaxID=230148 RepID=A0A4Z2ELK0_9TELE|nr:hypothetical protein EYF80_060537 [Liparis tanakae]
MRITLKSSQFHGSRRNVNLPTQKPLARIFMSDSKVLQRSGHQAGRRVPVDKGEGLPRLQVAVGPRPIVVVVVDAALRPRSPGLLLGDAPLDGGQRLGAEGAEAVRSGRYKQLGHLVILLLQRAARGSAGTGGCGERGGVIKLDAWLSDGNATHGLDVAGKATDPCLKRGSRVGDTDVILMERAPMLV